MLDTTICKTNNTNNVNKTCALLQTTGGKDEPNIVFMQKLYRTSQHGTQNIKTHNRSTWWATRNPPTNRVWTRLLAKGKKLLIIQSSPVKVLAVIEDRNIYVKSSVQRDSMTPTPPSIHSTSGLNNGGSLKFVCHWIQRLARDWQWMYSS